MRVVTWNMGLADRTRRFTKSHDEAWRYLLALTPDLAFLQEAFPPGTTLDEGTVVRDPFKRWGSLIYSATVQIQPLRLPEQTALRALPDYLAFASFQLEDEAVTLAVSVHAPPRRAEGEILGGIKPEELRRSVEGPNFNDAIFAGLKPMFDGARFIAAGDWNTARRQRSERDSRAGELFFERVLEAGWHDCVWTVLQDEVRTWFGPGSIVQDDYIFTDASLGRCVADVSVADEAANELHLSDHAPLIVDFDLSRL
jgi:hypothetical protein